MFEAPDHSSINTPSIKNCNLSDVSVDVLNQKLTLPPNVSTVVENDVLLPWASDGDLHEYPEPSESVVAS